MMNTWGGFSLGYNIGSRVIEKDELNSKNQYDVTETERKEWSETFGTDGESLKSPNGKYDLENQIVEEGMAEVQILLNSKGFTKELTPDQQQAILEVHFEVENNQTKGLGLRRSGLSEGQVRVLMEYQVCGFGVGVINFIAMKKLWMDVNFSDLKEIGEYPKNEVKNLIEGASKDNKLELLIKAGVKVTLYDLKKISEYSKEDIENLISIENLGLDVYFDDLEEISKYSKEDIENLISIGRLGLDVYFDDLEEISKYSKEDIENLTKEAKKDNKLKLLIEVGLDVHFDDLEKVSRYSKEDIENLISIENLGLDVHFDDLEEISKYSKEDIENLTILENLGLDVHFDDLKMISKYSKEDMKNLIKKIEKGVNINILRHFDAGMLYSNNIKGEKIQKFLPEGSALKEDMNFWEINIFSKKENKEQAKDLLVNMKSSFIELQSFLLENQNALNFPKHIVGISHLSKFAKRYGFEIIDLPKEVLKETISWNRILNPEIYSSEREQLFFVENGKTKIINELIFELPNGKEVTRDFERYKINQAMSEKFKAEDIKMCTISIKDFLEIDFQ